MLVSDCCNKLLAKIQIEKEDGRELWTIKKKGLSPLMEKIKVINCGSIPVFSLYSFIYGGQQQDQHHQPFIFLHVIKYI